MEITNFQIINCDILEVDASYIAHQCNATSNRSFGLSSAIFKKYPRANIYSGKYKEVDRELGSIIVRENIINMIAQTNPGKPKGDDSKENRLTAFEKCLAKIGEKISLAESTEKGEENFSVAFPYGIGCGLAGGDWSEYLQRLKDFANLYPNIDVILCKL